jgi:enoyl-CoA hydratase/carnithine racemase
MNKPSTPSVGRIITRVTDGVGWVVMDNPNRKNALSEAMFRAIIEAVDKFEGDEEVRVIVLRGAGDEVFSAGADLTEVSAVDRTREQTQKFEDAMVGAITALETCRKATIAMLQGFWIGGGSALAMACDLRIAADSARFALTPAKLALAYDYKNTKKLVDLVGPGYAKEILITARQFSASETAAMGLVSKIVPKAELEATVLEYAARIAANAPLSILASKRAIAAAMRDEEGKDLSDVEAAIATARDCDDADEGKRAFLEKRAPKYTGR